MFRAIGLLLALLFIAGVVINDAQGIIHAIG
jgi:hypothetical protein